jgi:hypothetical protein
LSSLRIDQGYNLLSLSRKKEPGNEHRIFCHIEHGPEQ